MPDDPIANMRARIDQCRRLANSIGSESARRALLEMAEQAEADIRKLEEERQSNQ